MNDADINTGQFVVTQPRILYGLSFVIIVLSAALLIGTIKLYFDDKYEGVILVIRGIWAFCIAMMGIGGITFLYAKNWKIEADGSIITITSMWGTENAIHFNEITEVKFIPYTKDIHVHSIEKRLFHIKPICKGYNEFAQYLKKKGILFDNSEGRRFM